MAVFNKTNSTDAEHHLGSKYQCVAFMLLYVSTDLTILYRLPECLGRRHLRQVIFWSLMQALCDCQVEPVFDVQAYACDIEQIQLSDIAWL
jgi:hypothetical protein